MSYKDRKAVAGALKDIYRAVDAAAGETALAAFDEGPWGQKYQAIGQSWRRAWGEVVPFYAFPADVRRYLIYNKRHCGAERQAAPGGPRPRSLPHRRGGDEAAVSGLEPQREGMDHARS